MKPSTRQRFVALRLIILAPQEQKIVEIEAGVDAKLAAQIVRLGQALRRLKIMI